jgi:para-aminobenzoate synthetase component 1
MAAGTVAQGNHNGSAKGWFAGTGKILERLKQMLQDVPTPEADFPPDLPFIGGWLGWLGYDLAWEIEQLPTPNSDSLPFPTAFWYAPDFFAVLDHHKQDLWLAAPDQTTLSALANAMTQCPLESPIAEWQPKASSNLIFQIDRLSYETAVQQAQNYIRAGDIFQANLSARFCVETQQDPWLLYQILTRTNPSPFASYWQTPWGTVVSCSPERLVKLRDRQAQTRPIAGTRPRGQHHPQDQTLAATLLVNPKERAEHIMLVDLERNDLGRVCRWGSVHVDELLTIERYSHVMHLVSNISGELKPDCDAIDLIRALFPGGTITGCPKVRCLEIINELEPCDRNLFYGSCGYLDYRGHLDLNILIRTLLIPAQSNQSYQVWGQVGAGIVADSNPHQEWQECLHKAKALLVALGLETFS